MMSLDDIKVSIEMIKSNKKLMRFLLHINFGITMVMATCAAIVIALWMGIEGFAIGVYEYLKDHCPDAYKDCYDEFKKDLSKYD